MGTRVGLLAGSLVLALGSGVMAQEPSPEPPPWLGGRVEMPEHGLAVTFPDEWHHADGTSVPDDWWDTERGTPEVQRKAFLERGGVLIARNGVGTSTNDEFCKVEQWSADSVQGYVNHIDDDPRAVASEPIRVLDLPGGRAVIYDVLHDNGWEWRDYLITDGERWVALVCGSPVAPEDRWLSIAETFEFLPVDE